jgi:hypothetical protein
MLVFIGCSVHVACECAVRGHVNRAVKMFNKFSKWCRLVLTRKEMHRLVWVSSARYQVSNELLLSWMSGAQVRARLDGQVIIDLGHLG